MSAIEPTTFSDSERQKTNAVGVVTGAGSGVGRAVVIALARQGWRLALMGRSEQSLAETAELAGFENEDCLYRSVDIGDAENVQSFAETVERTLGPVEILVNSAGTNTPRRALLELSLEDYHAVLNTHLNGVYYCAQAFLPAMRCRKKGTIVNVVSDAALQGTRLAGAAYTMSKYGQRGLSATINAEEGGNGIRACAVLPGEIDTPLLKLRPSMPSPKSRDTMLQPEDVADCVMLAVNLPPRAVVQELLVRPRR